MGQHTFLMMICNTFKMPTGDTETIMAWKSKGVSDESIMFPAPKLKWFSNSKIEV